MPITSPSPATRLGFHYFPDTFHYRMQDLEIWLPELLRLGASWITLWAPVERAIPEHFLCGLMAAKFQPILHFQLPTLQPLQTESFRLLFSNYARWGVQYAALYDRPNVRTNWLSSSWVQMDLVERFLDHFLPLAVVALQEGLTPVFPPLEPGGDYWDLAFLRTALRGIQRRGHDRLLEKMALGAYAWTGKHSVDWGAGGPEHWPGVRPYFTPSLGQDHLGFRIFDWYLAISQQELGKRLPVILLRAGSLPEDHTSDLGAIVEGIDHARTNLALARLLSGDLDDSTGSHPVPPEVLACNFWLLAAQERSEYAPQAWFQPGGKRLPVVGAFRQWVASLQGGQSTFASIDSLSEQDHLTIESLSVDTQEAPSDGVIFSGVDPHSLEDTSYCAELHTDLDGCKGMDQVNELKDEGLKVTYSGQIEDCFHPISHYVLLPLYAWGVANWDLSLIQPILEESHPTVGFSLAEARLAARVTVVGGSGAFSMEALEVLRASGCSVERLLEDGTLVAT